MTHRSADYPRIPQPGISPNPTVDKSNMSFKTNYLPPPSISQYTTVEGNCTNDVSTPGSNVKYVLWQYNVYISCSEAFKYLEVHAHIYSRGYKSICQALFHTGKETTAAFLLFKQSKSHWVLLEALLVMLEDKKMSAINAYL